jgi:hypothetical protein
MTLLTVLRQGTNFGSLNITNLTTNGATVITPVALTEASPTTWNWATAQNATLSLTASRVISNPTNAINGQYASLRVVRTGAFQLSFDTLFKGVSSISQSTTSGFVDHFVFRYNGTNFELVSFRANIGA